MALINKVFFAPILVVFLYGSPSFAMQLFGGFVTAVSKYVSPQRAISPKLSQEEESLPEESLDANWVLAAPDTSYSISTTFLSDGREEIDNRDIKLGDDIVALVSSEEEVPQIIKPKIFEAEVIDYSIFKIARAEDDNFERLFNIHRILWTYSEEYQKIWNKAVERHKKHLTIASVEEFDFEAFADIYNGCNIIIRRPYEMSDAQIGSLIAFELTNIVQYDEFMKIDNQAASGYYEKNHSENPARRYAIDKEALENITGKQIHYTIIQQAIANSDGLVDETWMRYPDFEPTKKVALFYEYIYDAHNDAHINYYVDEYNRHYPKFVEKNRRMNAHDRIIKKIIDSASQEKPGKYERWDDGNWHRVF